MKKAKKPLEPTKEDHVYLQDGMLVVYTVSFNFDSNPNPANTTLMRSGLKSCRANKAHRCI